MISATHVITFYLDRALYTGGILGLAGSGKVVKGAASLARNFLSRRIHLQSTNIEEEENFLLEIDSK